MPDADMTGDIEFALLTDRPGEIARVARWWFDEWGLPERHPSFAEYVRELEALTDEVLPIHLIAERAGRAVGVATLKTKVGHHVIPGQSHWLSGVYVEPSCRCRGVATALCQRIVLAATRKSITRLYLQTEYLDGGLYSKLGWTPVRKHREGGVAQLIMVKDLQLTAECAIVRGSGTTTA
jgi:N-acetylglutamate synthase-like GNAT family acetyltransferase